MREIHRNEETLRSNIQYYWTMMSEAVRKGDTGAEGFWRDRHLSALVHLEAISNERQNYHK